MLFATRTTTLQIVAIASTARPQPQGTERDRACTAPRHNLTLVIRFDVFEVSCRLKYRRLVTKNSRNSTING
jgi:hypothetical protein